MKLSEHFDSSEFRCHGPECLQVEPIVDPELIENLEQLRGLLNANLAPGQAENTITVDSGCRCPVWNSHEGGKTGSSHLYDPITGKAGKAADVWCPTRPVGEVYQAALTLARFKGIGLAPPGKQGPGYVHLDVRDTATRSQWGYNDEGLVCALAEVLPRIGLGASSGVDV